MSEDDSLSLCITLCIALQGSEEAAAPLSLFLSADEGDGAGASSSHQGEWVHSASLKLPLQAGTFTVLGPPAPCWRRYWRWARSRQWAVRPLQGDDTGLDPGAVPRRVRQRMLYKVAPSCPSNSPSTASACPKMHSFVHVLSSLNPTAPHHESTSPLAPPSVRCISMRDDHVPSLLFDTVGSQRGPTEVVYALVEGKRLLSTSLHLLRWALVVLAARPSPRSTRGWTS